jgi:hypothetical protein
MKMSNRVYDVLKWGTMIVLPALATAYAGLAIIWGFPYGEQIVGTFSIVETFLGAILKISNAKYKKDEANKEANKEEGEE